MTNVVQLHRWLEAQRAMRLLQDAIAPGITFFSICSGIEAASVAWNPLGWKCKGVAEIEKFPSALLAHHYPTVPNYGDFTKIKTRTLGRVDILCGGTPCQAFSIAGARGSLDDARGNLTLAFVELAHELVDGNGLRNVVWENVPGVLSTHDNAFGCFLAGLVGASGPFVPTLAKPAAGKSNRWWGWSSKERKHYIKWPRYGVVVGPKGRAAWTVKDAQYYGLAQRRERVLVVADFGNGADPAAVLFEPEGVRRHSPPSRETGEGTTHPVAPSLTASGRGVERTGDTRGQDPVVAVLSRPLLAKANDSFDETLQTYVTHAIQAGALRENPASGPDGVGVQAVSYAPPIARCVATREGSSLDFETTTMVAVGVTGPISHALKAEGADASEDGTGRGTPIVLAFDPNQITSAANRSRITPELCHTLPAVSNSPICFSAKDYGADATHDLSPTLRAGGHSTSHANAGVMPAVAYGVALRGREDGATAELGGDVAYTLRAAGGGGDKPHILTSAVRRLTPRECERLQGFQFLVRPTYPGAWQDEAGRWWSPDYTAIPWRGKPAALCPDGPRYKALGNSWAVPKFRWLGERIARFMPRR